MKLFETMAFLDLNSNGIFDRPITSAEVNYVVKVSKHNKSAGSDGIVVEQIKYGGNTICEMLSILFKLVWNNEYIST